MFRLRMWWDRNVETRWFKKNSIIKFEIKEYMKPCADQYPFEDGEHVIYLGEISNMRGHIIVAKRDGRVIWGYHPDNFVIPDEDEI